MIKQRDFVEFYQFELPSVTSFVKYASGNMQFRMMNISYGRQDTLPNDHLSVTYTTI